MDTRAAVDEAGDGVMSNDLLGPVDMWMPDLREDMRPPCPAGEVWVSGGPGGDFCMDRTEVTVAAYGACVDAKKCSGKGIWTVGFCNWRDRTRLARHPINCLTWDHAMRYCEAHGKTLPVDQQWEFAARGAMNSTYPWGNQEPDGGRLCWWQAAGTCLVGQKPTTLQGTLNPSGLADLAGNVWEMTSERSARGEDLKRLRGGSWREIDKNGVTTTRRISYGVPGDNIGFRCVRKVN